MTIGFCLVGIIWVLCQCLGIYSTRYLLDVWWTSKTSDCWDLPDRVILGLMSQVYIIYESQQIKGQYEISSYFFKTLKKISGQWQIMKGRLKTSKHCRLHMHQPWFYSQLVWSLVECVLLMDLKNPKSFDFLKLFLLTKQGTCLKTAWCAWNSFFFYTFHVWIRLGGYIFYCNLALDNCATET